jgi:diphthamide synthase (EF-2-diphthine--ammonia ligase)
MKSSSELFNQDQLNEKHDITGIYPLWNVHPAGLIIEFLNLGYKTMVVAVNSEKLGSDFLGKTVDIDFIQSLPLHVDPCAENGEFHTFCYEGPGFAFPISIETGIQSNEGQHHFQDLFLRKK